MSFGIPYAFNCKCYRAVICPVCGTHVKKEKDNTYAKHWKDAKHTEEDKQPYANMVATCPVK